MPGRVLLICYYFPPLGMGGISRPINLFQELPKLGWDCHILTVKGVAYRGYETDLVGSLDRSRIHRSGSYDPQRILYLMGVRRVKAASIQKVRAASSRFFPDSKVGWVGPAIRLGRKLLGGQKYDVIVSTSPPISCHLIGRQLSHEFRVPWVADFRDYWSVEKVEQSYDNITQVHRGQRLLNEIRDQAAALTSVNASISDYLGSAETIRNAYNEKMAGAWTEPQRSDSFRIGLLGHQLDDSTWEPLLDVLALLRSAHPEITTPIELIQVGQIDRAGLEQKIAGRVKDCRLIAHGQLSRAQTVSALNDAHLMYLGVPEREGLQFVPGRVYDMLASGRPILCSASGRDLIAQIIEPTGVGCCFDRTQIARAKELVLGHLRSFLAGTLKIAPRPEYAKEYGARYQAESFVRLFESLK
jgi:hypothetical protein